MDAPVKRGRGRPRKPPSVEEPVAPRLDPRRFAAAWAGHLIRHSRAKPTTATVAAALLFADGFGLYEIELERKGRAVNVAGREALRKLPARRFNATAVFAPSRDQAARPDDAEAWPIARLRSEAKMILRTLRRLESDAGHSEWLDQSIMVLGIMTSGKVTDDQIAALKPLIVEMGWGAILPKLAQAILSLQKHSVPNT